MSRKRTSGLLLSSPSPSPLVGKQGHIEHCFPSFLWDAPTGAWKRNYALDPQLPPWRVLEEVSLKELPRPRYTIGDWITFSWSAESTPLSGPILEIHLWGYRMYWTVGGREELPGSRSHAKKRCYDDPDAILYVVESQREEARYHVPENHIQKVSLY